MGQIENKLLVSIYKGRDYSNLEFCREIYNNPILTNKYSYFHSFHTLVAISRNRISSHFVFVFFFLSEGFAILTHQWLPLIPQLKECKLGPPSKKGAASKQGTASFAEKKKKNLSDKLGPQWSNRELENFYEVYGEHGRDWKKGDSASVVGFIALMKHHYNVSPSVPSQVLLTNPSQEAPELQMDIVVPEADKKPVRGIVVPEADKKPVRGLKSSEIWDEEEKNIVDSFLGKAIDEQKEWEEFDLT
ncbi:hypothetical protein MTR_1g492660 [Medicago truncatula]|uniref:Uncharacterized protein n=1 Tax=Medicago truncatula TaxID=3880 RepID=A0A072VN53_MEDTR|nr:hypothetical protein MTR_1g492660 [Medicago truncatula]